ncbi:MAG: ribonuclease HII [Candidatus Berkelbacteria bacterium Gr01-1014_85]|uniref:Ribonuclease n=1 Tax=Candidatus Berkelbacteria bacterium Gr01-1014_85 TaxID=2017150 RepID=A0A554JBJ4_9BACT|nr:MAG: ribonuclease HII [Candidatus Berkelbacteria bacterium Gr01-1014_85]
MAYSPIDRRQEERWAKSGQLVIGLDEVGRGAWAGPLMVGAWLYPIAIEPASFLTTPLANRLTDSKLLTPRLRATLAPELEQSSRFAVASQSATSIDQVGLTQALRLAYLEAALSITKELKVEPSQVIWLLDGKTNFLPLEWPLVSLTVKGDQRWFAIAAASVIAKVRRDELMTRLAGKLPGYGFEKHKGYGTTEHRLAIQRLGLTTEHRQSYQLGL